MKAEDIVEGLNRFLEERRTELGIEAKGFFVLQREINQHPTFKAFKEYRNTLWYVKGSKKTRVVVVNLTEKVIDPNSEDATIRKINTELSKQIFGLISKDSNLFITDEITWK